MMKKKTRIDVLAQQYLCKKDISTLLNIPHPKAKKLFDKCMAIDKQQLGDQLIFETRVRMKTVLKVSGQDYNLLVRQIKNADALTQQSAK